MTISVKSVYSWYRNLLRNPQYRWWAIIGTLVYLISPVDVIPDIIPIAGQLDDLMILTLFMTEVSQLVLDYAKSNQANRSPAQKQNDTVEVEAVPLD
ncbi:MAG: YkvA family protein [Cyanophyceae cyanobacterium]